MEKDNILEFVNKRASSWISGNFNQETKNEVQNLLKNNETELIDAFYKDLEFGTGGLRGIMGAGTNRINIYTVGMATQGLCNYLHKEFNSISQIKVAIAHDSRHQSRLFSETAADIFSANNIKAYLFDSLRPTPELSFAIRHFKCQSGIVITASHNPKEYNGYKVYWEDGGQIIFPHDKNIIAEVQKIKDPDEVKFTGNKDLIEIIGAELDEIYINRIKSLSLSPEVIKRNNDLRIVYTPIHGTGVELVPMALRSFGFENIYNVPEQDITDGSFPTVKSPNPEEVAALDMALKKGKEVNADIIMGTDPDADRVGVAAKDLKGDYVIINGNQTAALLINYIISALAQKSKLSGKEYIVKTIVTSEILTEIAESKNVNHYDVLTGFKYIADVIKKKEGKEIFICGGEESYGYLAGEFVRDKDAVMSCALIAETAAWAKDQGKSLYEMLIDIYIEYSFYKEKLVSVVRKGKSGAEEIQNIMDEFRNNPPESINNSKLLKIKDYLIQKETDIMSSRQTEIDLPVSNVLQFYLEDHSKISVRPSGTEPKIKFYFSVKEKLHNKADFEKVNGNLDQKIDNIIKSLNIS